MNKLWLLLLLAGLALPLTGCEVDGEVDVDDDPDASLKVDVDD